MATQPDENKPTIVLVHGAWADATGFDPEIRALQREGFLDAARVTEMWHSHLAGHSEWQSYLWTVLMFQAWTEARNAPASHCLSAATA